MRVDLDECRVGEPCFFQPHCPPRRRRVRSRGSVASSDAKIDLRSFQRQSWALVVIHGDKLAPVTYSGVIASPNAQPAADAIAAFAADSTSR